MVQKLFYITNARIPTEKAHGLQILKMCEAFQQQGMQVTLMVPFRFQSSEMQHVQNLWQHYDIRAPFTIKRVLVPDFVPIGDRLPEPLMMALYYLQCLIFSKVALVLTLFQRDALYYSRDLQTIFVLCLTKWLHRKQVYFEAHELHGDRDERSKRRFRMIVGYWLMRWMLHHIDGLIVITHRLKIFYANMGIAEQQIFVAHDGLDKNRLALSYDQANARRKLHISLDRKVVCYTGHLFQWKGVYTLAESIQYLPEDYVMYVVGGRSPDIEAFRRFIAERQLRNLVVTGYVPYMEVPTYLSAADVLVLPNTATAKISRECTSPLKLFEYMSARRPIVASDLPSLREVLRHKDNAYLVPPDDARALAEGIVRVMNDVSFAEHLVHTAFREAQLYTWDVRAEKIIGFLEQHNKA